MPTNGAGNQNFVYLPSISLADQDNWSNHSRWIEGTQHRFENLTPYTTYNVTVYVRLNESDHVDPPYLYINVTTPEGIPSEPLNVTVIQLNSSRVQISWEPPKSASGILKEYTVYYRAQTISVQQAHSVKVSPQEHTIILESNFEPNTTYEYWVRARNSKNESPSSKLVRLTFDNASDMDRLTGLHVTLIGKDYIQVEWNEIKNIDGYSIQTILPQKYPKLKPQRTQETKFRVENLVQGVNINIKVSGYKKNFYGRPASISSMLPGNALPEIPELNITDQNGDVLLQWSQPNGLTSKNITYGIYYATTLDELFEEPKLTTQSLQATLKDLLNCESYLISVGIVGPVGPGPLLSPKIYETKYNEKKPPRNVKATMNSEKHLIEITWESSCQLSGQIPTSYSVNVTELTTNNTKYNKLNRKGTKVFSHIIRNVPDGAVYSINISTNVLDAEQVTLVVHAPQLPPVRQLKVYADKNGTFTVFWHGINDNNAK